MKPSSTAFDAKPLGNLTRLSRIGVWVSAVTILLGVASQAYVLFSALGADETYVTLLLAELGITLPVDTLNPSQLLLTTLLWISTDILGLYFLFQVHLLFRSFLHPQVFTADVQRRMRSIGWIIFSMAPVNILSTCIAGMFISAWKTDSLRITINIDSANVYAIIIGLVIAAVSHIMLEASRLSDENRAFV